MYIHIRAWGEDVPRTRTYGEGDWKTGETYIGACQLKAQTKLICLNPFLFVLANIVPFQDINEEGPFKLFNCFLFRRWKKCLPGPVCKSNLFTENLHWLNMLYLEKGLVLGALYYLILSSNFGSTVIEFKISPPSYW